MVFLDIPAIPRRRASARSAVTVQLASGPVALCAPSVAGDSRTLGAPQHDVHAGTLLGDCIRDTDPVGDDHHRAGRKPDAEHARAARLR